jgi:hypothetical protein
MKRHPEASRERAEQQAEADKGSLHTAKAERKQVSV